MSLSLTDKVVQNFIEENRNNIKEIINVDNNTNNIKIVLKSRETSIILDTKTGESKSVRNSLEGENASVLFRIDGNLVGTYNSPSSPEIINTKKEQLQGAERITGSELLADVSILNRDPVSDSALVNQEGAPVTVVERKSKAPLIDNPQVGMRVQTVNTGGKFDFYLAPAMQSNFRMPGGRDTPNALPGGLNIRMRPNISKTRIPGSTPVYQNLGIDSVIITVVGAFTGGNLTGEFYSNINTSRLNDQEQAKLDTYRDYNEFLNLINLGEELDIEINLNQQYGGIAKTLTSEGQLDPINPSLPRDRFSEQAKKLFYGADTENKAINYLRQENGNPRFTCFVRDMQYAFVRDDLSYYVMQFEVTDFTGQGLGTNCITYTPAKLISVNQDALLGEQALQIFKNEERFEDTIPKLDTRSQTILQAVISELPADSFELKKDPKTGLNFIEYDPEKTNKFYLWNNIKLISVPKTPLSKKGKQVLKNDNRKTIYLKLKPEEQKQETN